MFCPKCGKPEQVAETFCRQCGTFLPDLSKPAKKEAKPEEHIKVNSVLSLMTVIVSFSLAILLYVFLGFRPETHVVVYVSAGLLFAMGGWHIQTFIRMRKLKKQWETRNPRLESDDRTSVGGINTAKLLDAADLSSVVPTSVTETTTKHLDAKIPR